MRDRGRDMEGVVKQWISFVKPNFQHYVEPQRNVADIIVPRGVENLVAIDMIVKHVQRVLVEKSRKHQEELKSLGKEVKDEPLAQNVLLLKQTPQIRGMNTVIQNPNSTEVDIIFYFDRLATLLVERYLTSSKSAVSSYLWLHRAMDNLHFKATKVVTPEGYPYVGLSMIGEVSAVVILRGGSCFETGLKRVIPDCQTGRVLIQTNYRTGEPELHYLKLPNNISDHDSVLLLDPQMSSGGAALMAVRVLIDHGVSEDKIVFVTYIAGKIGANRLLKVFPEVKIVVCRIVEDYHDRWVENRYWGC